MQMPVAVKRNKILINKQVQIKYALLAMAMLLLYTLLLLIALFGPPIYQFTSPGVPMSVMTEAANAVLFINSYLWPWIGLIILLFGILTIFFTHRIAGPMFSLQRTLGRIAAGDLKTRIKFRKGDDFSEMAGELNRMAGTLESLLSEIDGRLTDLSSRVQTLSKEQVSAAGSELLADVDAMRAALASYRYGNHPGRGDNT